MSNYARKNEDCKGRYGDRKRKEAQTQRNAEGRTGKITKKVDGMTLSFGQQYGIIFHDNVYPFFRIQRDSIFVEMRGVTQGRVYRKRCCRGKKLQGEVVIMKKMKKATKAKMLCSLSIVFVLVCAVSFLLVNMASGHEVDALEKQYAYAMHVGEFGDASKYLTDEVRNIWFTDIAGSGKFATTPFLVKIDEEHFAVLWEERRSSDDLESFGVYCVIIDGNGESCSEIKQFENARLSQSCQPIVYSNSILWYVDYYGSKRVFYEIDLTAPEDKIVFTIDDPTACVFGQSQTYDVASIIRNGRTMLPARYVAEAFGANVSWDAEKREVAIQGQDVELKLYLGSDIAYVNGEAVKLDTPAMVENGRTYTPVRFVAEHLGANVRWKADTRNVVLTMP